MKLGLEADWWLLNVDLAARQFVDNSSGQYTINGDAIKRHRFSMNC